MKHYLLYIMILLLCFSTASFAQAPRTDHALIFTLTKDFTYSGYYKGIGYKFYNGSLAYRFSAGGEYNITPSDSVRNVTLSVGFTYNFAETQRTAVYAGTNAIYNYREYSNSTLSEIYNIYGISLILGGEVFVFDNVSLGLENSVVLAYNTSNELKRLIIGNFNYNSSFLINVYF